MPEKKIWWKHGVVYQIYPRSFYDSNGDGIGDIPGIISKLDYIAGLGVDAIWLSPVNMSPMFDFGYDVSDYREIDPIFGKTEDYSTLIKECHKRDLKIIMDLVFNHSSHLHPWFIESRSSRNNPKSDWYIWRDGKKGKYPNNWMGEFGGRAWEWDEVREQYYLHLFLKEQPDLNWRNNELRQAVYEEFRYWLDAGVDGFRLDVINFFVKDKEFRNNPFAIGRYPRPHDMQKHIYNRNQPELHDILHDIRSILDGYYSRMMVGETFADDMNPAMPASYMGDGSDELHLAFDFSTMFLQWDAKKFFNSINSWINAVPNNGWPCHVFSNHDQPRSMTRFGKRNESESRGKVLAVLLLTLKGTPFLYYGEELGMANRHIPKKHIHDPVGLKYWPIPVGRDGERTPMQWTPGINAGFTAGEPWLPLNNNYTKVNVQTELKDEKSFLNFYKSLIKLRKRNDILAFGSWEPVNKGEDDILSYRRIYNNRELLVILNFSSKLKKKIPVDITNRKVLFSTHRTADSIVGTDENYIYPYEATVLM